MEELFSQCKQSGVAAAAAVTVRSAEVAGSAVAPALGQWEPPLAAAACPPAMYSPSDKMMNMKPLAQAPCFPGGRYSPPATYRPTVDPMRRCVNSSTGLFCARHISAPPALTEPLGGPSTPQIGPHQLINSREQVQLDHCPWGNIFGGLEDNLLSRAEALADMGRHGPPPPPTSLPQLRHEMVYGHPHPAMGAAHTPPTSRPHQMWDMMYMGAPRGSPVPPAKPQQVAEVPRERWMCPPYSEGLDSGDK
ncbi:hypothetical protein FJT64_022305 [Amphibalanus amphitrite]|uniref:Uncharacterized protein n=1 Tax=Amphibalanus amphitrite TaxID=1232801 RepID=A0A6A4WJ81_AMPAM|nr:hypothetical protein FJT64_022305 [Amphibalanus amphitrite]